VHPRHRRFCTILTKSRPPELAHPRSRRFFYKPIDGKSVAVLLMNHDSGPANFVVNFADVPGLAPSASGNYAVRDIWAHKDLGTSSGSFTATNLASHDSAFITLTPA